MKQGLRPLLLGCQVAAAALSLQALASAQCPTPNIGATVTSPPVPQPGLTEVWVDPINGNDATGIVGDGTQPFLTATTALNQLQLALTASGGASAANRGLVHLDAGIYSLTTNGETFPIVMSDFVDIQGIGAKQTVLRGTADATVEAFRPLTDSSCNCGVRDQNIVLVDFSDAIDDEYDEMIDGVTFQGADIQVYAEAREHAIDGRISNCVFDLLDGPNSEGVGYAGPDFGILMVHAVQSDGGGGPKGDPTDPPGTGDPTDPPIGGDPTDPPGTGDDGNGGVSYNDVRLHVFNNTFVQSWDRDGFVDPEPDVSAADTSVAICDVNDPACGSANPDPNPLLRGVGNPNIQNNLIRAFDDTPPIALMGIDNADVTCAVGTRLGATNAFDPAAVAGPGIPFPSGLAFCSTIVGALPTVVTDTASGLALNPNGRTGGQDPAFVGEALAVSIPGLLPAGNGRDWRLIASSIYADDGTLPILATGILGAANGTQHTDLNCAPQSSFDLDGEYWGNDRVAASPLLAVGSAALVDNRLRRDRHPDRRRHGQRQHRARADGGAAVRPVPRAGLPCLALSPVGPGRCGLPIGQRDQHPARAVPGGLHRVLPLPRHADAACAGPVPVPPGSVQHRVARRHRRARAVHLPAAFGAGRVRVRLAVRHDGQELLAGRAAQRRGADHAAGVLRRASLLPPGGWPQRRPNPALQPPGSARLSSPEPV